tara:strand:- start:230 stop:412 length:183 start_codon:yes stop_codon:yes gene_type:complete
MINDDLTDGENLSRFFDTGSKPRISEEDERLLERAEFKVVSYYEQLRWNDINRRNLSYYS